MVLGNDLAVSGLSVCAPGTGSINLMKLEDSITIVESSDSSVNSCGSGSLYIPESSIFYAASIKIVENTWRSGENAYLRNFGYSEERSNNTTLTAVLSDQSQNNLFDLNSDVGNIFKFYGDALPYNTINIPKKHPGVEITTPSSTQGDNTKYIKFTISIFFMVIGPPTDKNLNNLITRNLQYYPNGSATNSSFTIETRTQNIILGSGTSTVTDLKIENGIYYGCCIVVNKINHIGGKISQVTLGVGYVYDFDLDLVKLNNSETKSNYHCINRFIIPSSVTIDHDSNSENVEVRVTLFYSIIDTNVQDTIQSLLPEKSCNSLIIKDFCPGEFYLQAIKVNLSNGKLQTPYNKKIRIMGLSFKSKKTILDMIKIQDVIIAMGIWNTKGFYAINLESDSSGVFPYSEFTTIEGPPDDVEIYIYVQIVNAYNSK